MFVLMFKWVSQALENIAQYITSHAGPDTSSECGSDEPPAGPRGSGADPAVVERNGRINRLELEIQDWRRLACHSNMERAREEHLAAEEIAALDRANRRLATWVHEMRRFHRSMGLNNDTEAVIRDLRAQRDGALERGRAREEELLREVGRLREDIRRGGEEAAARREKNWVYSAYIQDVNKWRYIARESVRAMKAAQKKAEEAQQSFLGGAAGEGGPLRADKAVQAGPHSDDTENAALDPASPLDEVRPLWMRMTYADGTPVEMPGLETDVGWETVSDSDGGGGGGDGNSAVVISSDDDDDNIA